MAAIIVEYKLCYKKHESIVKADVPQEAKDHKEAAKVQCLIDSVCTLAKAKRNKAVSTFPLTTTVCSCSILP